MGKSLPIGVDRSRGQEYSLLYGCSEVPITIQAKEREERSSTHSSVLPHLAAPEVLPGTRIVLGNKSPGLSEPQDQGAHFRAPDQDSPSQQVPGDAPYLKV
jgi:hypothetical protein